MTFISPTGTLHWVTRLERSEQAHGFLLRGERLDASAAEHRVLDSDPAVTEDFQDQAVSLRSFG